MTHLKSKVSVEFRTHQKPHHKSRFSRRGCLIATDLGLTKCFGKRSPLKQPKNGEHLTNRNGVPVQHRRKSQHPRQKLLQSRRAILTISCSHELPYPASSVYASL